MRHATVADERTAQVDRHQPRAVLIVERAQVAKVIERAPLLGCEVATHEQRQAALQMVGEEACAAQLISVHLEHLSAWREAWTALCGQLGWNSPAHARVACEVSTKWHRQQRDPLGGLEQSAQPLPSWFAF